jgi:amino acid transporter
MRSEEKLNELFKTLREGNVTTSVSDVSSWINAYSTSANIKTVKKTAITKKIIIMSAIITTAIIGSIILFSGEQSTQTENINSPIRKEKPNI